MTPFTKSATIVLALGLGAASLLTPSRGAVAAPSASPFAGDYVIPWTQWYSTISTSGSVKADIRWTTVNDFGQRYTHREKIEGSVTDEGVMTCRYSTESGYVSDFTALVTLTPSGISGTITDGISPFGGTGSGFSWMRVQ
jgi:hypothetical protein